MQKKVEEREKARKLRSQGMSLRNIADELCVTKSSVSMWVRDMPQPYKLTLEYKRHKKEERQKKLEELRKSRTNKSRLVSGDGRWMIPAPEGYQGKTYIGNRYVYEHRYLMEQSLGRLLSCDENVHHVNGDKLDNRLENLRLMSRRYHSSIHAKSKTMVDLVCAYCGRNFKRDCRHVNHKISKGQKSFYCDNRCTGKAFRKKA